MRASRAVLIVVGVLGVLVGLAVAGGESVEQLDDAWWVVRDAPGGVYCGAVLGLGLAILVWSLFAPRTASGIAATVPGVALVVTLGYAFAWRSHAVGPTFGGRLAETANAFHAVTSAAVLGLAGAAMAAAWVSLALALRARAEAHEVTMNLRTALIPIVPPIALVALLVRLDPGPNFRHLGVLPVVLCILSAMALSTVGRGPDEDDAAREAWAAMAFAVLSVVLVGATAGVIGVDRSDDAWSAEWRRTLRLHGPATLAFAAAIFVLFALATPLRLRTLPRAVHIIRGPLGAAALAAGVLVWTLHGAGNASAHLVDDVSVPRLSPGLVDDETCADARLDMIVAVSAGSARLPGGAPVSDPTAAIAALDGIEADEDLWVAPASDATPFRPLGELLRAATVKRAPRGVALVNGASSPPVGCGVHLVGKTASGTLACTELMALDAKGCVPEPLDDFPLHIALREGGEVELSLDKLAMKETVRVDALENAVRVAHDKHGHHSDPYDRKRDVAIVTVPPSASLADVLRTLEAVRAVQREFAGGGRRVKGPAYFIALGLPRAPSP